MFNSLAQPVSYLFCVCVFGRRCSLHLVWVSQVPKAASQTAGGAKNTALDLSLLSRYKRAVMKIYESSLQGMGVSIRANVTACLLFSYHLLCHDKTQSWWSLENQYKIGRVIRSGGCVSQRVGYVCSVFKLHCFIRSHITSSSAACILSWERDMFGPAPLRLVSY